MARGCPAWRIGVAALATPALLWVRDARACSCIGGVHLQWPAADGVDVALDTSVVVAGVVDASMFGDGAIVDDSAIVDDGAIVDDSAISDETADASVGADAGSATGLYLISTSGEQVGLALERVVPATACVNEYYFAAPRALLSADTRYELRQGSTVVAAFTTGTKRRDAQSERQAAERLSFEVLGATSDPAQITTAFVTALEPQPLYLNFTGSDQETTLFLRRVSADSVQLNFGSLVCPEVRVLGSNGEPLVSRSLCDAQRCLQSDGTIVVSSCGGNYAVDIDYARFQALPLGCPGDGESTSQTDSSAPRDASNGDADSGLGQDEPNKVAVRHTDRGCAVVKTRGGASGNESQLLALVTVVVVWLRRRVTRYCLGRAYNQTTGTPS